MGWAGNQRTVALAIRIAAICLASPGTLDEREGTRAEVEEHLKEPALLGKVQMLAAQAGLMSSKTYDAPKPATGAGGAA